MSTSTFAAMCTQQSPANITGDILSCKRIISTLHPKSDEAFDATMELVALYRQAGDLNLANQALDELLQFDLKDAQQYQALRQKGINTYRQRNYIQALEYFHDAQLLSLKLQENNLKGQSANDLANVYQALGDLDTALTLFLESYQIAKELNDTRRQAITLNNLGNVSRDINQLDDAILSFRQAHQLHQQTGDQTKANHTLISLAEVLFKKNQLDRAVTIINDVIEPLNQSGTYAELSRAYLLLAEIAIAQNDIKQADQWLDAQKRTRQLVQTSKVDQRALLIEAKLKQLEGDHVTAQSLLKQGLNAHSQQNSQLTELFYIELVQSQLQSQQFKDAVTTLQNYNNMLKNSRAQSTSLYQLRMRRANVLQPSPTQPEEGSINTAMPVIAFFTGLGLSASIFYYLHRRNRLAAIQEESNEDSSPEIEDKQIRQLMVEIMSLALSIWEQSSGKTRIELAEESKAWKVNIDDGRLRVRTLERYLNIKTLPKKPRWRNIISTAGHVISHCPGDHAQINTLKLKVQQLENVAIDFS
ncbi:tetratricopeptide repeat protein [Paraneptunicella aestuarii]|uniref:tetratricopeptide repeat protein n=1 Tax=Paraneptunicella aestuarii TaxID=2831148 RepID=UPI001E5E811F|nr:tetratricopeptide repeat protein [Paraneptunicella aestuarii]UAA37557.1 tetratricopeptide repeat protein [Paraneptunicella aestuarii]